MDREIEDVIIEMAITIKGRYHEMIVLGVLSKIVRSVSMKKRHDELITCFKKFEESNSDDMEIFDRLVQKIETDKRMCKITPRKE